MALLCKITHQSRSFDPGVFNSFLQFFFVQNSLSKKPLVAYYLLTLSTFVPPTTHTTISNISTARSNSVVTCSMNYSHFIYTCSKSNSFHSLLAPPQGRITTIPHTTSRAHPPTTQSKLPAAPQHSFTLNSPNASTDPHTLTSHSKK